MRMLWEIVLKTLLKSKQMTSPAPLNHETRQSSQLIIECNWVGQELKSMLLQITFFARELGMSILGINIHILCGHLYHQH